MVLWHVTCTRKNTYLNLNILKDAILLPEPAWVLEMNTVSGHAMRELHLLSTGCSCQAVCHAEAHTQPKQRDHLLMRFVSGPA